MKMSLARYCGIAAASILVGWVLAGMMVPNNENLELTTANKTRTTNPNVSITPDAGATIALLLKETGQLNFQSISAIHRQLQEADTDDCRKWLALVSESDSPHAKELRAAIVMRWAELDPEGTIEFLRDASLENDLMARVFRGWAASDLDAAVETALKGDRPNDIYGVMWGVKPDQIEHLYNLLLQRGFDRTAPGYFDAIYIRFAELDIARAAQLTLGRLHEEVNGFENVMNQWVNKDARAALAWVEAIENPRQKQEALNRLVQEWVEEKPIVALEAMWEKADFSKLFLVAPGFGKELTDAEFERMLSIVDARSAQDPLQADHALKAMAVGLSYGGGPPERLAALASRMEKGIQLGAMESRMGDLIARWAEQDEKGLEQFINTVDNNEIRSAAVNGLIDHWNRTDPQRALALMKGLGEPMDSRRVSGLVSGLLETAEDPETIPRQLPEEMRDDVLSQYARQFGRVAPEEVAEFLDRQPLGSDRSRAMLALARLWADSNPQTAAEWFSNVRFEDPLEERNERSRTVSDIAENWALTDFDAAIAWAEALTDRVEKVNALSGIAKASIISDPMRAINIASQILDHSVLSSGLRSLAREDPQAAIEWFDEHPESRVVERSEVEAIAKEMMALKEAFAQ